VVFHCCDNIVVLSFANISSICFLEEGKEAFQEDDHDAIPEDDHDHDDEEVEDEDEQPAPAPAPRTAMAPTPAPVAPAAPPERQGVSMIGCHVFRNDEIPWIPFCTKEVCKEKCHDRVCFKVELPSHFDGKSKSHKAAIEQNGMELVVHAKCDEVLANLCHIHSMLEAQHGRAFSDDSSKTLAWKCETKKLEKKSSDKRQVMGSFRTKLPFECRTKLADDLAVPGIVFRKILRGTAEVPLLILELKSNHVCDCDSDDDDLSMATFVSPAKKRGGGTTAEKARALDSLFKSGFTLDDLHEAAASAAAGERPGESGAGRDGRARKKREDDEDEDVCDSTPCCKTP
jgi:hypothetical protein